MSTAIAYLARKTDDLARKTNEIFERRMEYAARMICERQSVFQRRPTQRLH
jgi:hypothetical protein